MELVTTRPEQKPINKKIDFEFQLLGIELQEIFPLEKKGTIWSLFYNPKFNERKIRDSMKAYLNQDIRSFRYFMGILHKSK